LRYADCGRSAVVAKCAVPVPKEEADGFARVLVAHPTTHVADSATGDDGRTAGPSIQSVFRGLVDDPERTRQICDDVAAGVRQGRNCLVLSQWTGHVANLADALRADGMEVLVLQGGMGKKARGLVMRSLFQEDGGACSSSVPRRCCAGTGHSSRESGRDRIAGPGAPRSIRRSAR
jgi:hypothetical protein